MCPQVHAPGPHSMLSSREAVNSNLSIREEEKCGGQSGVRESRPLLSPPPVPVPLGPRPPDRACSHAKLICRGFADCAPVVSATCSGQPCSGVHPCSVAVAGSRPAGDTCPRKLFWGSQINPGRAGATSVTAASRVGVLTGVPAAPGKEWQWGLGA